MYVKGIALMKVSVESGPWLLGLFWPSPRASGRGEWDPPAIREAVCPLLGADRGQVVQPPHPQFPHL